VKHTAEVQVRNGAQVSVELTPEEVVAAWSRGGQQQHQRSSSSDADPDSDGVVLPSGQGRGKGYDWHKRTRQGKEYEMWFTDHDQLTEVRVGSARLCH
jgi:putative intracellular protease/amidase